MSIRIHVRFHSVWTWCNTGIYFYTYGLVINSRQIKLWAVNLLHKRPYILDQILMCHNTHHSFPNFFLSVFSTHTQCVCLTMSLCLKYMWLAFVKKVDCRSRFVHVYNRYLDLYISFLLAKRTSKAWDYSTNRQYIYIFFYSVVQSDLCHWADSHWPAMNVSLSHSFKHKPQSRSTTLWLIYIAGDRLGYRLGLGFLSCTEIGT